MAVSVSAPLADHVERLHDAPAATGLVATLQREGFISMKDAAEMYGRKTHKSTPTRHALHGVKLPDGTVVRLEAIRVSGALVTSRAAVLRFFAAQNPPTDAPVPAPTPAQQSRRAAGASKKVDALLGVSE